MQYPPKPLLTATDTELQLVAHAGGMIMVAVAQLGLTSVYMNRLRWWQAWQLNAAGPLLPPPEFQGVAAGACSSPPVATLQS